MAPFTLESLLISVPFCIGEDYILTANQLFTILIYMLVIRMQRIGRRNDPAFRVVLTEKRSKPKSGQQEILGSFHPKTKETVLKNERILYWISQGAQVSDTVRNLLVSKGVMQRKKRNAVIRPVVKDAVAKKAQATATKVITQ